MCMTTLKPSQALQVLSSLTCIAIFSNNKSNNSIANFSLCYQICDCLSENPPSLHLPVAISRNTILKIQLKTSLALVLESFTEHNNTWLSIILCMTNLISR